MNRENIIQKLKAILRLANDNSAAPGERETALLFIKRWRERHGITDAELQEENEVNSGECKVSVMTQGECNPAKECLIAGLVPVEMQSKVRVFVRRMKFSGKTAWDFIGDPECCNRLAKAWAKIEAHISMEWYTINQSNAVMDILGPSIMGRKPGALDENNWMYGVQEGFRKSRAEKKAREKMSYGEYMLGAITADAPAPLEIAEQSESRELPAAPARRAPRKKKYALACLPKQGKPIEPVTIEPEEDKTFDPRSFRMGFSLGETLFKLFPI